jgi:hypothetical protein
VEPPPHALLGPPPHLGFGGGDTIMGHRPPFTWVEAPPNGLPYGGPLGVILILNSFLIFNSLN